MVPKRYLALSACLFLLLACSSNANSPSPASDGSTAAGDPLIQAFFEACAAGDTDALRGMLTSASAARLERLFGGVGGPGGDPLARAASSLARLPLPDCERKTDEGVRRLACRSLTGSFELQLVETPEGDRLELPEIPASFWRQLEGRNNVTN